MTKGVDEIIFKTGTTKRNQGTATKLQQQVERDYRDDHKINLNRSYCCLLHECKRVACKILENFLAISC